MSTAELVVTAVTVQGRAKSKVAGNYRLSRRWVHELIRRYEAEGETGLQPRSRRPRRSPQTTPRAVEDQVVALRKRITEQGLDAGAKTIAAYLSRRSGSRSWCSRPARRQPCWSRSSSGRTPRRPSGFRARDA